MSKAKIQSGDTVKVTSGNYKGTVGLVTRVQKKIKRNGHVSVRATISEVPKIVKYRKSQQYQGQAYPGTMLYVDRTIDISNLSLLTADGTPSKVRVEVRDGKKVRVLKKTGEIVSSVKIEKNSAISTEEQALVDTSTPSDKPEKKPSKKARKTASSETNS